MINITGGHAKIDTERDSLNWWSVSDKTYDNPACSLLNSLDSVHGFSMEV